jgi:hypothetical protein
MKGKAMSKVSYREARELLANREAFTGNSMSARYHSTFCPDSGRLDPEEYARLRDDFAKSQELGVPLYVVYSYNTPIAWALPAKPAYVVEQKFSSTTSRGQNHVRAYIDGRALI